MRENVVAKGTKDGYLGDNRHWLLWCFKNQPNYLTEYAMTNIDAIIETRPTEKQNKRERRINRSMDKLIKGATRDALVHLSLVTPERFMQYLEELRHCRTGMRLSTSAYGNKRAALSDMFRRHGVNPTPKFEKTLSTLFTGFLRSVTTEKVEGQGDVKEGKDAMSVELYRKLAWWFLMEMSLEGVWAYCFLILTWCLMCRVNNTSKICMKHIQWNNDALRIYFTQQKTDQSGKQTKYPRHLYANSEEWLVCPVFALALYVLLLGAPALSDSRLFPGKNQFKRFGSKMKRVLKAHEKEVNALGFQLKDLGTHSIRKGASTYASSLPGGPSAAAIAIRAGWSMGTVKDVYIRYEQGGDQFVGRVLSMLPLLSPNFAVAPPQFSSELPRDWIDTTMSSIFSMVTEIPEICGKVTEMLLASLIRHSDVVSKWPSSHVIVQNCVLFRQADLVDTARPHVRTPVPWDKDGGEYIFTGVPPMVAVLHEVHGLAKQQETLVERTVEGIEAALDRRGVDIGSRTDEQTKALIRDATAEMRDELKEVKENLSNIGSVLSRGSGAMSGFELGVVSASGRAGGTEAGQLAQSAPVKHLYRFHTAPDGRIRRLPLDWRFPTGPTFLVWQQWLIGDHVRNVPPLRTLEFGDVRHLDKLPLEPGEKRRPARKILSDLRFLMNSIESKVRDAGQWTNEHTAASAHAMFLRVAHNFILQSSNKPLNRDGQKSWQTTVLNLRLKSRRRKGSAPRTGRGQSAQSQRAT